MSNYRLSAKALSDLMEIGMYTEQNWGVKQRNKYLKEIDDCFSNIAEKPKIGVRCDYIRQGYRKLPQGSHIIFYRLNDSEIVEIIRILHKSMDVQSHL